MWTGSYVKVDRREEKNNTKHLIKIQNHATSDLNFISATIKFPRIEKMDFIDFMAVVDEKLLRFIDYYEFPVILITEIIFVKHFLEFSFH